MPRLFPCNNGRIIACLLTIGALLLLPTAVAIGESGGSFHDRGIHYGSHANHHDGHHGLRHYHQYRNHRLHRLQRRHHFARHGSRHGLHLRFGDHDGFGFGLHRRHDHPSHRSFRHGRHHRFEYGLHSRGHRLNRHRTVHDRIVIRRRTHELRHDRRGSDYGTIIIRSSDPHEQQTHREPVETESHANESRADHASEPLAHGETQAAVRLFADLAPASPGKAGPKVGYALAMTELGRYRKAVWAMRRAITIDSEGFGYVTVPPKMHDRLTDLAHKAVVLGEKHESDGHTFLAAAIYHLIGNGKQAIQAPGGISEHDAEKSTRILRQLVSESEY